MFKLENLKVNKLKLDFQLKTAAKGGYFYYFKIYL